MKLCGREKHAYLYSTSHKKRQFQQSNRELDLAAVVGQQQLLRTTEAMHSISRMTWHDEAGTWSSSRWSFCSNCFGRCPDCRATCPSNALFDRADTSYRTPRIAAWLSNRWSFVVMSFLRMVVSKLPALLTGMRTGLVGRLYRQLIVSHGVKCVPRRSRNHSRPDYLEKGVMHKLMFV